jgi:ATP-dependent DNA helicase RecG
MINPDELQKLILDLESDRVERTISTNNTDKFSEAVCAFSNDFPNHRLPGYLIVGVKDDGQIGGIEITDNLLLRLSNLWSDGNIQPLPTITVQKITLAQGSVAVVKVQPSNFPPVRYKGRTSIRVGPRKAIASEQEERLLSERRVSLIGTFDTMALPRAFLSEMSMTLFQAYRQIVIASEIIAQNHRSIEEQMASLRFYHLSQQLATVSGILLFGLNPRFFLPGAYIQYLALPNQTLTDEPLDQREISGDLLSVLRELDLQIKTNNQASLQRVSTLQEKLVFDYPEVAIRELLVNAILHRDYQSFTPIRFYWFSDRIEIQSPGGLYGEVTAETMLQRNSYRNPVIAEAMKALGYVNRFGYGIQRAQAELERYGHPKAEFVIDQNIVLCIIRKRLS